MVGPRESHDQGEDDPDRDGEVVGEVHEGPGAALLAGLFHDAEDVHQDGED